MSDLPSREESDSSGIPFVNDPTSSSQTNSSANTEQFIRFAFDQDVNTGMSLLFRHYYPLLCSHAGRFVSSREIAEDIVSDIFFEFQVNEVFKTIKSSFRAYLFTCVRHRAFDYVRTEMRRSTSLDNADVLNSSDTYAPDSITQFEELYQDVENVLKNMPLRRRQIYLMHRFEGKRYREIAEELGLSLRTVETHGHQAAKQLRTFLQNKWMTIVVYLCLVGS